MRQLFKNQFPIFLVIMNFVFVSSCLEAKYEQEDKFSPPSHPALPSHTHLNEGAITAIIDKGDLARLKSCIEQEGLPVNWVDRKGRSLLQRATDRGHLSIVTYLLEQGADANQADPRGNAPLYMACAKGHLPIVDQLIAYKATLDQADDRGVTPLYIASKKGYEIIVDRLCQAKDKQNINKQDIKTKENGETPLWIAAKEGHQGVVATLLKYKANPNEADKKGISPLLMASYLGHKDIALLLLKHQANPNQPRDNGTTPLMVAKERGYTQIVEELLTYGASEQASSTRVVQPGGSAQQPTSPVNPEGETNPFAPTAEGYMPHPTFTGAIHKQTYAIWKEIAGLEISRIKPLIAKNVPDSLPYEPKVSFHLGKGNFGTTYVGCDLGKDELVAIKEVHGKMAVDESRREGELQNEVKDCPQIMPLIDFRYYEPTSSTGQPHLLQAMPLAYTNGVGYKDMLTVLKKEDPALHERIMIDNTEQLMQGLAYLHQKKIYHLDLKAENILYMLDGSLRIADFGRAQKGKDDTGQIANEQLGDVSKFSPEQVSFVRFRRAQEGKYTGTGEMLPSFSGSATDTWAGSLYILEFFLNKELFSDVLLEEKIDYWDNATFQRELDGVPYLQETPFGSLLRRLLHTRFQERVLPEQALKDPLLKGKVFSLEGRSQTFNRARMLYQNSLNLETQHKNRNEDDGRYK